MCDADIWTWKSAGYFEPASEGGLSAYLDEAITNSGEVALILEQAGDITKIVGYTLPRRGEDFDEGEIRNAFLSQAMDGSQFKDSDREKLGSYLNECVGKKTETRSVFKYKPVALKTKPVFGELPAKFRIKREIIGDPLADMPKLLTNPPEFEPMGRYTLARKEKIDDVHKGDFLSSEEKKLMHHFMCVQNEGFAWEDMERGRFPFHL